MGRLASPAARLDVMIEIVEWATRGLRHPEVISRRAYRRLSQTAAPDATSADLMAIRDLWEAAADAAGWCPGEVEAEANREGQSQCPY